ncbi:hypothetical protein BGZ96_012684 [Linnemannia gamsii]|uniref:Adhesin domain-containing protein n=1 Tax=Linnemannia gamsii TaxID=64522 RepID=A0ABQ7KAR6_9FUNG|nr:hypothetical protein BGZ96_012684 [Linnemannia gamsii]
MNSTIGGRPIHESFPDNSCSNADDDKTSVETMFVPLVSGLNLNYQANEEVAGNIVVNESDVWDPRGIRIHIIKRASSNKTLSQIVHSLKNLDGTVVSRVHLSDSLSKDEKEKIKNKKGCLRADVQITYPRAGSSPYSSLSGSRREVEEGGADVRDLGALSLSTISGEISVKFKSTGRAVEEEKIAYRLDTLKVAIVHGDVEVNNVIVVKKTHVEIVNGQVSADLTTAGLVKVDMINGGIGLTINSAAPHSQANMALGGGNGWSPENLDVEANAVNGLVGITFRNHFHGHFALESLAGSTSFTVPEGDRKTTPSNPGGKIEGWVSEDGKEPLSALPRLAVKTRIGNIKIKVQPNNNYQDTSASYSS